MKKIISLISAISILFTLGITAFAAETAGGQITLTQFLGTDRNNTKSITIYVPDSEQAITVDKDKFFDISDNMMLTSSLDPVPIDLSGTYITADNNDGTSAYAFIGEAGGVDKYSQLMSRNPYALYTVDNLSLIDSLLSLAQNTSDTAFSDIKGHWAEETIIKFKDKNIISGYPDGTFKPDNSVTRAEFAKIIALAFGLQEKNELNYDDVKAEIWYYPYLECSAKYIPVYPLPVAYETNIPYQEVREKGLNYFLPETAAIRMHIAETLAEIKKDKEDINVEIPTIQDIQKEIQSTFKDADYENLYPMHGKVPESVQRMFEYTWLANELGIMQGDTDGYFRPYDKVTRAELLTAIDRLMYLKLGNLLPDDIIDISYQELDYPNAVWTLEEDKMTNILKVFSEIELIPDTEIEKPFKGYSFAVSSESNPTMVYIRDNGSVTVKQSDGLVKDYILQNLNHIEEIKEIMNSNEK